MNNIIVSTQNCRDYGQPEFQIQYDPDQIIAPDIDWLVYFLEEQVKNGEVYVENDTVQIGWMINLVKKRKDDTLGLFEPDMKSIPISWIDSVNTTLRQMRLQIDVAESLHLKELIQFPSIRDSVIVGQFFETCPEIVMERVCQKSSDSGWFVGSANPKIDYNNSSNLKRISLYELACKRPDIVMYFGLPSETSLVISKGCLEATYKGKTVMPYPGSFLELFFDKI